MTPRGSGCSQDLLGRRSTGFRRLRLPVLAGMLGLLAVSLSGCSWSEGLALGWPKGITEEGDWNRQLWIGSVVAALVVGVLVWALMFWSIAFHRKKATDTELPRQFGYNMPLELVLTGEAISAERAREIGLVNWLVPENQLEKTVDRLIAKVCAQSGPVLSMAKKAILGSVGMPLREGVKSSMKVFLNELAELEDSQEGLRALVEKRAPKWKNR